MTWPDSDEPNEPTESKVVSDHDDATRGPESQRAESGDVAGRGISSRSKRPEDVPADAGSDASTSAPQSHGLDEQRYEDDDAPLPDPSILALIQANQHLHLPAEVPDAVALAQLRQSDPEAYHLWLNGVEKRSDHDMWVEKAPYLLPHNLAARGQLFGLLGLVLLTGLAGLAIVVGQPWVAGIFGVLDFVGIVVAFSAMQDNSDS